MITVGAITLPVQIDPELAPGAWMNNRTTDGSPLSVVPPMIGASVSSTVPPISPPLHAATNNVAIASVRNVHLR